MSKIAQDLLLTPYAKSLGIAFSHWEGETPVLSADYNERLSGRPGALHGGAISGVLETASYAVVRARLADQNVTLKPINFTVQFLRAGALQKCYSSARIVKLGRRTANVSVEAWQDDRDKPIAAAVMNIMLVSE
jgi:uncharacterized protein (TIGR00369 family)